MALCGKPGETNALARYVVRSGIAGGLAPPSAIALPDYGKRRQRFCDTHGRADCNHVAPSRPARSAMMPVTTNSKCRGFCECLASLERYMALPETGSCATWPSKAQAADVHRLRRATSLHRGDRGSSHNLRYKVLETELRADQSGKIGVRQYPNFDYARHRR